MEYNNVSLNIEKMYTVIVNEPELEVLIGKALGFPPNLGTKSHNIEWVRPLTIPETYSKTTLLYKIQKHTSQPIKYQ